MSETLLKNSILIVTLTLSLNAYADAPVAGNEISQPRISQSDKSNEAPATTQPQGVIDEIETTTSEQEESQQEQLDPSLPRLGLTSEMMFRILASELGIQRGEWRPAYATMLTLAHQTRDPRFARRAAEIAQVVRQDNALFSAVKIWRELAPQSAEANEYFLEFAVLANDLDSVRPILEKSLQEVPERMRGRVAFQMHQLLARAKDKTAAFAMFESLVTPYLNDPEVRVALALSATNAGQLERARTEAKRALELRPEMELAVLSLAQATTDRPQAASVLREHLVQFPEAREVRLAYARMLVEMKDYAQAREQFQRLLRDDPHDLTSQYALGVLSIELKNLDEAEQHLTRYIELTETTPDPERDPAQALLLLAQIAEAKKDDASLLKWLGMIDVGPAYLEAQIKRAHVLSLRDNLTEARKVLREASTENDRDAATLVIAEARLLREAKQFSEAIAVYEAGLQRLPDNTDLLYELAMLWETQGQLPKMESLLRKIIALDANHAHAHNALGYSLADRKQRLPEARELIVKALSLTPEDPFIMDSMGWVEYRLGKLDEAEKLLTKAFTLRPDAEIAVHLGEVLWMRGKKDAALKLWKEVHARDPENATLKQTLQRFNVKP